MTKGLQKMSNEGDEVKKILNALKYAMNRTATDYTGQHIAMCLYGMQSMRTAGGVHQDVNDLLFRINERLYQSAHNFSISNIASAMFGLKVISNLISSFRFLYSISIK